MLSWEPKRCDDYGAFSKRTALGDIVDVRVVYFIADRTNALSSMSGANGNDDLKDKTNQHRDML
jgi:hypothetical protein